MIIPLPILDEVPPRPAFARGPRDLASVRLLRMSVTDRCNFRCMYCMPEDGVAFADRRDLLSASQLVAIAAAARRIGIDHFKITGGEPTVRPDLVELIARLRALRPADLSMTTNGALLDRLARPLREAGLDRLTVSLDSLDPDTFQRIIGRGERSRLDRVLNGLDAAVDAGFERIKLNCVIIGGVNDHEAPALAALTLDRPWTVRFIEYMPLGDSRLLDRGPGLAEAHTVDNAQVLERIEAVHGRAAPVDRADEAGVGPARVLRLPRAIGRIGFISAMSRPFCETCNRLRLTATGELRACLFDGGELSVLPHLDDPQALVRLMRQCVAQKPETHGSRGNRAMSQLGG